LFGTGSSDFKEGLNFPSKTSWSHYPIKSTVKSAGFVSHAYFFISFGIITLNVGN